MKIEPKSNFGDFALSSIGSLKGLVFYLLVPAYSVCAYNYEDIK